MDPATALIVISEIMYNPASDEKQPVKTEWVEIYNPGDTEVDMRGWYLEDEDGKTGPLPEGVVLPGKGVLVLIPGEQTWENFQAAWGDTVRVVPLENWSKGGMQGLANSPSDTNEVLTLRRPDDSTAFTVNYDDQKPWPADSRGGASIYLTSAGLADPENFTPEQWSKSEDGVASAKHATETAEFSGKDVGSPGVVDLTEAAAEPASDIESGDGSASDQAEEAEAREEAEREAEAAEE